MDSTMHWFAQVGAEEDNIEGIVWLLLALLQAHGLSPYYENIYKIKKQLTHLYLLTGLLVI